MTKNTLTSTSAKQSKPPHKASTNPTLTTTTTTIHDNNAAPTRPSQHNLEKRERIKEELEMVENTQVLCVPHCGLLHFPDALFGLDDSIFTKLRKLDISHNHIVTIPKEIKLLSNLREIWLSFNPITTFPSELIYLKKLEILDIRHTQITTLPTEMVDLPYLIEFDWRETPLEQYLLNEFQIPTNALTTLQTVFRNINIRKKTKDALFALLFGEHYIMDADKGYARDVIATFVDVSMICSYYIMRCL